MRTRSGSFMPLEEEEMQKEQLAGMAVPEFEKCPDYTAMEVLSMEAVGSSIWTHAEDVEPVHERSCRTFVYLLIDAVCRDGNASNVALLWESLASSDGQLSDLLGPTCTTAVVEVNSLSLVLFFVFIFCFETMYTLKTY